MAMFISCGPTSDDAIKYNDSLVNLQSKVFEKESALIDAMDKNTTDKIDPLYKDLLTQIDKASDTLEKIGKFGDKTDMKDAVMKVLATYKSVATNEYPEIIRIAKMPDSLYSPEEENKRIDLSKKIDDELDKVVNDFLEVQKGFSVKYKFELSTAEKEKK
jgi:AAA15 family ATPase/GTPase